MNKIKPNLIHSLDYRFANNLYAISQTTFLQKSNIKLKHYKYLLACIILLPISSCPILCQSQLDVQGINAPSADPVVNIWTNAGSGTIVLGLQARALSSTNGIGGYFSGSSVGLIGEGFNLSGLEGRSDLGIGIKGKSQNGFGGYFLNDLKTHPDLVIGGNLINTSGVISSDPDFPGSSLFVRSNNAIVFQMDHDNNSDGFFALQNGSGNAIFSSGEEGNIALAGNSTLAQPQLFLRELENSDFARIRLKNDGNNEFWDVAGGGPSNADLNFYQSTVGDILQLHATGNPITTSTGAYLSSGGMWTNNSSASLKNIEHVVDPVAILSAVTDLPLYRWEYKTQPDIKHLGPTAEEFHKLFKCGDSDKHLAASDMAAVALAAIQALEIENQYLLEENQTLKNQIADIMSRVDYLTQLIGANTNNK